MQQQADQLAGRVVVGMDPHKRSVTIELMTADETVLGGGRYATDEAGFAAMMRYVNRVQPDAELRVWAVDGCNGIGHHVAMRLLAASEHVVDVPPKMSARVRVFATGQGRKTDATDLAVLRVLVDRRRSLGEDHTRMTSQVHHLLLELIPGGAKKDLSAAQAKALLAKVRPRDAAGKTRRRVAAELISGLERIYARKKAADKELRDLVKATGTGLMDGDITRFPDRGHFASWNGTAPIDASSGDVVRHQLSRAGNRQINRILHTMAIVQLRNPTLGRDYYDRRKSDGKSSMEAMRCLKRRLSDIVYRTMLDDSINAIAGSRNGPGTGPGGQRGNGSDSSATGSQPHTSSSEKSLPRPANTDPRAPIATPA
jgi:transposase